VNLYGASELETTLTNGEKIKLAQETDYPWNGRVRIRILDCGKKEFALKLRIPGWVKSASVRINNGPPVIFSSLLKGENGEEHPTSNIQHPTSNEPARQRAGSETGAPGYWEIRRVWKAGDFVDLDLPMPVREMEANPLVEEDLNQVAVQRGPVVYCLESPDLPPGVKISDVFLPSDMKLAARYDQWLLDGVVVLEGQVLARTNINWTGQLYREHRTDEFTPIRVKFIPYSVWQNRGASEMSVWLPLAGN
jgi:DUF1680 family protein